jgi:hypothetical protein
MRRSRALRRFLPVGARTDADSSRWDSRSSRCNARSCFKLSASVSSSDSSFLFDFVVDLVVLVSEDDGGFAL